MDWTIKFTDIALVISTLSGPVLAVQAQKWIERSREATQRRVAVFRTLMATRAATMSPAHVEALNAIPIEFYGKKGPLLEINELWKTYLDYLSQPIVVPETWTQRKIDLYNQLLAKIADFLGYKFTLLEIKREVYFPNGHAQMHTDQEIIRQNFAKLLRGDISLPVEIKATSDRS